MLELEIESNKLQINENQVNLIIFRNPSNLNKNQVTMNPIKGLIIYSIKRNNY
jgi:hypothetical protein